MSRNNGNGMRLMPMVSTILIVVFFSRCCDSNELKDYCSVHRYENLIISGLRFTKEVVTTEYANVGAFKAIHCCLRGYRSIEWYKDNRAYPWPGGESHFILYPESANQTIYTQEVRSSDAGRYSCRARNDTTSLEEDITLQVLGEEAAGYTGKPLPTYKPASQMVPLGASARLFCEAYLGRVDLPDAKNSVTWSKVGSNLTLPDHGRLSQHRVSREDDEIVGSYLEIEDITLEDYGEYECRISNGVDDEMNLPAHIYRQEPLYDLGFRNGSWRKTLLFGVLVLVIGLSVGAFYARCWLPLAVMCRDRFGLLEEDDGKECDALVCYHERDSNFAVGILVPTLESRHRFKCTTLELTHVKHNWGLEIGPHAASARRIIVVLGPNALENVWTESSVAAVLKQLSSLSTRTIIISLKDLPNTTSIAKSSRRNGLAAVSHCNDGIAFDRLTILRWEETTSSGDGHGIGGYKFWYKIRMSMPPMRPPPMRINVNSRCQSVGMIVQANGNKSNQQKARSRESLEVLV
ncbi:uncharacterized protein [Venturia canescens]|uniref:uncharacterized protein n=1 Tax=Venturia canescens TaxID=32260 RepID=UPI001C9D5B86|nr:uncharacterized protein LOC122416051 [Venturia canescens]